jgi:hypothetical protein
VRKRERKAISSVPGPRVEVERRVRSDWMACGLTVGDSSRAPWRAMLAAVRNAIDAVSTRLVE